MGKSLKFARPICLFKVGQIVCHLTIVGTFFSFKASYFSNNGGN
jgi:hypothetical protein